jgi:hypothetical protein
MTLGSYSFFFPFSSFFMSSFSSRGLRFLLSNMEPRLASCSLVWALALAY